MRRAGTLLHISSLPGPGPIGSMGAAARRYIDFLQEARQSVWQVLPVTPPALHGSPYSSYSVFAGNPWFIDLEALEEAGMIARGRVAALPSFEEEKVDFAACERYIMPLLREAFKTSFQSLEKEISAFRERHGFWLEDYALYMSIRTKQGDISYHDWPKLICVREERTMDYTRKDLAAQMDFWVFLQYLFFTQWTEMKDYANRRGVSIMGDLPIYTADDSADVWACPHVFQLDERRRLVNVAGVPPDGFAPDGQRWGNPLYDWEHLKEHDYEWWIQRLKVTSLLCDEARIDHFRGLDEYYAIPAGEPTARVGVWKKGPGMDFFDAVNKQLPGFRMVAEDLGFRTEGVVKLLEDSGLPGMNILLFGFDPRGDSDYLPHNHKQNSVAYIGTHDNETAMGWIADGPAEEVRFAVEYLQLNTREGYHWGMIRGLYESVADTAMVQMQDFLGLDNTARMNTPGTVGGNNWMWRLREDQITDELARKIGALAGRYGRQGRYAAW